MLRKEGKGLSIMALLLLMLLVHDVNATEEQWCTFNLDNEEFMLNDVAFVTLNCNEFVGEPYKNFEEERNKNENILLWTPEKGESIKDLIMRVKNFIGNLNQKHINQNILLITHGGVIHSLKYITTKTENPNLDHLKDKKIDSQKTVNCCVGTMEFINNKPKLTLYNCTKHLK